MGRTAQAVVVRGLGDVQRLIRLSGTPKIYPWGREIIIVNIGLKSESLIVQIWPKSVRPAVEASHQ